MQLCSPLIDDLLDGVVALLVGVGANALKWFGAIHIRALIANVDERSVSPTSPAMEQRSA